MNRLLAAMKSRTQEENPGTTNFDGHSSFNPHEIPVHLFKPLLINFKLCFGKLGVLAPRSADFMDNSLTCGLHHHHRS